MLSAYKQQSPKSLVILLDSVEAIHAIAASDNNDDTTIQCRSAIQEYQCHAGVAIQWIPSHCGILGNEKADMLARRGATQKQPPGKPPLSLQEVKAHLKGVASNKVKDDWEEKKKDKDWAHLIHPRDKKRRGVPSLSRSTEVASFRLNTGHDLLAPHLHRINLRDSAICTLCKKEDQDRPHLFRCEALLDIRDQLPPGMDFPSKEATVYWAARKRMA